MTCSLTYRGTGECSICHLSLKPKIGQELRQTHTNAQGIFCASCCTLHRESQVVVDVATEIPLADFSEGDGW